LDLEATILNSIQMHLLKMFRFIKDEENLGAFQIVVLVIASDCYKKAQAAGCTGQYSYYENTGDCYCK
jgi:hypothetical protein